MQTEIFKLVEEHYNEVRETYDKYLPLLAKELEALHGVSEPIEFWNVLLTPFLFIYLEIIRGFNAPYDLEKVPSGNSVKAKVMAHLWDLRNSLHEGKLDDLLCLDSADNLELALEPSPKERSYVRLKKTILNLKYFFKSKGLVSDPYLSEELTGLLIKDFGYFPYVITPRYYKQSKLVDREARKKIVASLARFSASDFERKAINHLIWALPTCFVEDFGRLRVWAKRKAKSFKAVLFSTTIYADPKFLALIARVKSNGGRLISHEHGAIYGQLYLFAQEFIERKISDCFVTSGWKEPGAPQLAACAPLPCPRLSELASEKFNRGDNIVWVGNIFYKRVFHIWPAILPQQADTFFQGKEFLYRGLSENIRDALFYRPYFTDYGWAQESRFQELFSADKILRNGKMSDIMRGARLIILDHIGTALLEAMAMNVPVVCFWGESLFQFRIRFEKQIAALRAANILFHDPAEAAKHINSASENIDVWWLSDDVQRVREMFCSEYAKTSKEYVDEWVKFIKTEESR